MCVQGFEDGFQGSGVPGEPVGEEDSYSPIRILSTSVDIVSHEPEAPRCEYHMYYEATSCWISIDSIFSFNSFLPSARSSRPLRSAILAQFSVARLSVLDKQGRPSLRSSVHSIPRTTKANVFAYRWPNVGRAKVLWRLLILSPNLRASCLTLRPPGATALLHSIRRSCSWLPEISMSI